MSHTKARGLVDSRVAMGGAAAALVVGIGIGLAVGLVSSNDGSTNAESASPDPLLSHLLPPTQTPVEASVSNPGIGQPVVDGGLQFVVNGVRRAQSITDEFVTEIPAGEFFIIDMTITNVGGQQATYYVDDQRLILNGQMLSPKSLPSARVAENTISTIANLNPGIGAVTAVVFDVPVGAQPEHLEVHSDSSSSGAYVRLR